MHPNGTTVNVMLRAVTNISSVEGREGLRRRQKTNVRPSRDASAADILAREGLWGPTLYSLAPPQWSGSHLVFITVGCSYFSFLLLLKILSPLLLPKAKSFPWCFYF